MVGREPEELSGGGFEVFRVVQELSEEEVAHGEGWDVATCLFPIPKESVWNTAFLKGKENREGGRFSSLWSIDKIESQRVFSLIREPLT